MLTPSYYDGCENAIWGCYNLSDAAVVEELLLRPQLAGGFVILLIC